MATNRLDAYGNLLNKASMIMVEEEVDRLRSQWGRLSETGRLLDILHIFRMIEGQLAAIAAPVAPGTEDWFAPRGQDALIESSRIGVLREIENSWNQGRIASGSFVSDLYALSIIIIGKERYATLAERETAYFLRTLSERGKLPLRTLRRDKESVEHGFDGFFAGTVPALRITADDGYVGLEVKTVVSSGSIATTLSSMSGRYSTKTDYRTANLKTARESKTVRRDPAIADLLARVTPAQIATLIVVRSCTIGTGFKLPETAGRLFDRVATFNVFGQPIAEACVGIDVKALRAGVAAYDAQREQAWLLAIGRGGGPAADVAALASGRRR